MRLKMRFEIKYIYSDSAIVAIAKPVVFDKNLDIAAAQYTFLTGKAPKTKIPIEFKGIARYEMGDVNNPKLAEKIARKKALRLAYSAYGNYAYEIYRYLQNWAANVLDLSLSATIKSRELNNDICDLVKND